MTPTQPQLDLAELRRLAEAATPGEWRRLTEGNKSIRSAAGKVTRDLFAVGQSIPGGASRELRDTFHDMTYVVTEDGKRNIALIGNGPNQVHNGDFVAAANPQTILRLLDLLGRLTSLAEKVAESDTDTGGTRAAAKYALTGSLEGAVHEMRRIAERPVR